MAPRKMVGSRSIPGLVISQVTWEVKGEEKKAEGPGKLKLNRLAASSSPTLRYARGLAPIFIACCVHSHRSKGHDNDSRSSSARKARVRPSYNLIQVNNVAHSWQRKDHGEIQMPKTKRRAQGKRESRDACAKTRPSRCHQLRRERDSQEDRQPEGERAPSQQRARCRE